MRTCSAPIPDHSRPDVTGSVPVRRRSAAPQAVHSRLRAFVLIEMILVVSLLSLFVLMVQVSFFGVLQKSQFKAAVQEFVSAMQMAASAAAESSRRYEMILDLGEQTFLLREVSSSNLADVLDEEIITQGQFGQNCRIAYVEYDDGTFTNEGKAKFRAGHAGWHYGGKIVFHDESDQPHTVVVGRIIPVVEVVDGDPSLLTPKGKDEVPFP